MDFYFLYVIIKIDGCDILKKKNRVSKIDAFFGISKYKSSVKVEIFAGIATFLAMAYILTVNPNNILWDGANDPRFASVFIATALGSFIGCLLMSFLAKMPLADAPGMGINAMVGSIIGGAMGFSFSYGNAMMLIFLSGLFFLLLSIIPAGRDKNTGERISIREKIFEGIPKVILLSIPVGIGLFITFIGLQNAKIIVPNEFTLVSLVDFNNPDNWINGGIACSSVVALFGLMVITILSHYKVKGSVIIGIISATILSIPLGVSDLNILLGNVKGISWNIWENLGVFFSLNPDGGGIFASMLKGGIFMPEGSLMTCIMIIISLALVDTFDTMGTIVGCCQNAGLTTEDGKPIRYKEIMYADSIASLIGAFFGTSTVTTFVESGAGVAEGGKTGLTALVTAILFLLSIFLLPLFAFIPSAAAASALIYVGVLMMKNVVKIDFNNVKNAVPAFLTIIFMVLAYSITDGIAMGIISFVIIDLVVYLIDYIKYKKNIINNKPKLEINIVTAIVFILFLVYFLIPTVV